jgi:hypothetical protein
MYTQMAKYLRETRGYEHVEFVVPQSEFVTIQIYDKTWLFGHGDHFNYRGGIGGVMIPFMGWMYKMEKILAFDKAAVAHWHSYINLQSGMINGSVIGYSPFAIGHGFKPEPPQQQFQLQDSKRGMTINTPIMLVDDWKIKKLLKEYLKENITISQDELELIGDILENDARINELKKQVGYINRKHAENRIRVLEQKRDIAISKLEHKPYVPQERRIVGQLMIREM